MKNVITILIVMTMASTNVTAQGVSNLNEPDKEKEAIKSLIEATILNGALNAMNIDEVAKGVHEDFHILTTDGTDLIRLSYPQWMEVLRKYKNSPEKMNSGIRNLQYEFALVDITGSSAIAKVQIYRNKQHIITDYISLLKFSNGWKAVAKVSNNHIHNPLHL